MLVVAAAPMTVAVPATLSESQLKQAMIAQLHAAKPGWLVARTSPLTITATRPASTQPLTIYLDRLYGFCVANPERWASIGGAHGARVYPRRHRFYRPQTPGLRVIVREAAYVA